MQNNVLNLTIRSTDAGSLTIDVRNTFPDSLNIDKHTKRVYYIDDVSLCGDIISIDYTLNETWFSTSIELAALKQFIINTGLNDYCFDSSDHSGEHIQDSGFIEMNDYLSDNLNIAIKAYLEAEKAGQYNIN